MKSLFYHIAKSLRFHGEKFRVLPHEYPMNVVQRRINRNGIHFLVDNITEANRARFLDGEEQTIINFLDDFRDTDIFYDIGACIGLFSLHASSRCRKVYAFEPDPGFRSHLEKNIAINNVENIFVLHYAVSDHSGYQTLYSDGLSGRSPSLRNDGFTQNHEVEVITLDDLIVRRQIPYPTVIKMDIEGAEIFALRGMVNILANLPPRLLLVEIHPISLANLGSSRDEVLTILLNAGYRMRKETIRDDQFHVVFEK